MSYPPVDALFAYFRAIKYRKHFATYQRFVDTVCIFICAVCVVAYQRWQRQRVSEKLQFAAEILMAFMAIMAAWIVETIGKAAQPVRYNLAVIASPPVLI